MLSGTYKINWEVVLNLGNSQRDVFYGFLKDRRGSALDISQWSLIVQILLAYLLLPLSLLVAIGESAAGQAALLSFCSEKT